MIKKKETPPITLAEQVSKIIVTPGASNEIIAEIDKHKSKMSAVTVQSNRAFKVRNKKSGKKQIKPRRSRNS